MRGAFGATIRQWRTAFQDTAFQDGVRSWPLRTPARRRAPIEARQSKRRVRARIGPRYSCPAQAAGEAARGVEVRLQKGERFGLSDRALERRIIFL